MRKFIVFITIVAGLLIFPIQAFAVDYSIEKAEINAYLQKNGDVNVVELYTYNFSGKFNGITRTLIPKVDTPIEAFNASENDKDLRVEQDDTLYEIHRSGKNETITVQLTYIIKNGVEVYTDIAQFYWPFFDSKNEADYEQLDIGIHPPEQTEDVIAYGYDAAWETEEINNDGIVQFNMGYVRSGQKGDIRVAYDSALFPNATLAEGELTTDDIIADQKKLEQEQIVFKNRQDKLSGIAPYIVGVFALYLFILLWQARQRRNTVNLDAERQYTSSFLIPELELSMPATIQYMNNNILTSSALAAALLDLVRQGYVKQTDETFSVINRETTNIHERKLIDWIFYKIGQEGVFHFEDLKSYTKKSINHAEYQDDFREWQQEVDKEVKSHDLFEKRTTLRWTVSLSSLLIIPFVIAFGIYELYASMSISIVISMVLLVFAIAYRPRTIKGFKVKLQWDQFNDTFTTLDVGEWSKLQSDEQMRAFIYGLGRDKKEIIDKSKTLTEQMPNEYQIDANFLLLLVIASSTNNHFSNAHSVSAASTSGGVPGGGGGGTGVGGGGGGSGAF